METLIVIGVIVFIVLMIRAWLIGAKRDFHNIKRSIVEARPLDDIQTEENIIRSVNSMSKRFDEIDKKQEKKQMKKTGLISSGSAQFCSACGGPLKPNARFCTACGNKTN